MSDHLDGPRACGKFELAPTLDLLDRVFTPDRAEMGHFGPHLFCEENRENTRVLRVGRRIVAHAGLFVTEMVTPRGEFRLGGVYGDGDDLDAILLGNPANGDRGIQAAGISQHALVHRKSSFVRDWG